jgi:hypothetical protein
VPIFADSQLPHDPRAEWSGCLLCSARRGFRDNRLPSGVTPLYRQSARVPRDTPHSTCFISRHGRDLLSQRRRNLRSREHDLEMLSSL